MKKAAIILAAIALPVFANTYQDPQRRFTIDIPTGWTAEPFGEGLKIARGTSYCLIMEGQAASPEALIAHLAAQFGGQWSQFQRVQQGRANLGGQAAPFSLSTGVNPKGVPSYLKVIAAAPQGRLLGLIESAPQAEYAAASQAFDQMEQGFRTGAPAEATGGAQRSAARGRAFLGLAVDDSARVGTVTPSGPAETAGIRPGDRIAAINRRPVSSSAGIRNELASVQAGDTIEFVIVRNGRQGMVRVQAGTR